MGYRWDAGPMEWAVRGCQLGTNEIGDQWDGGPFGLAEIGWMKEKGDQYVVGDLWIGGPMRRGPMRWGTNEMGDQWVGGTNEMGDRWNGWCMGANWGTNEMGDWWVGGPMRWGTNEMGDQWDGGPLGLADDGVTNEKGDQWDGGPMIWGTNEMGDQWAPIMYWGTNELGDQWEGDQWDGGPMRWGTSERIPAGHVRECCLDESNLNCTNFAYYLVPDLPPKIRNQHPTMRVLHQRNVWRWHDDGNSRFCQLWPLFQGSFCICAHPMRGDVTR